MNKKTKIISLVAVAIVMGALGYFFLLLKPNYFHPPPRTVSFKETNGGCGDILVYKINSDNAIGISVSAKKEKLNLSTAEKTFEIGKTDGLDVVILIGEKMEAFYCNDVASKHPLSPKKLVGKSGEAVISISDVDASRPKWEGNYKATVVLKDVHFSDDKGSDSDIVINELIFRDVRVGWYPG